MAREPRPAAGEGIGESRDTARNPGSPFDAAWIRAAGRARSPAPTEPARAEPATADDRGQILELVDVLDLTTLAADDTAARVRALCRQARSPLPRALRPRGGPGQRVAAVCIYPAFLGVARDALAGSGVDVAVVAGGFPDGLSFEDARVAEVDAAAEAGADEIDVVIARHRALAGDWRGLYDEVRGFRRAAKRCTLKVIIAASELQDAGTIARASATCLLAGADFLKTSTGREARPATIDEGAIMLREILRYERVFDVGAGFKAAGGIRIVSDAVAWRRAFSATLGAPPDARRFRIGASRLLDDVRNALERDADPARTTRITRP